MLKNIVLTGFADEIDGMLDRQMEVIKKLGMSYIEMRGVDGKNLVEYPIEKVKEIKSRIANNGIRLSAIGSPLGKIGILDDFAPHMELFKHTVEIAHVMEVVNIRMFSFYIPEGDQRSTHRSAVIDRLGQFAEYASANKITLLHENETGIYGEKAADCLDLMKEFYGTYFKAVFDFANFVQAGQDTMEAYEMLKPYIAYIHIKDAERHNGRVVPSGYGDGRVKDILKLLNESGYNGFLSLEPHLSHFTGFDTLEQGGKLGKTLTGEEAFTLAHDSLMKILCDIL